MNQPVVAIVGRPNVGKSTLFNALIGKRISIVDDKPGVTRDRVLGETEWSGKNFIVIDTGGIELDNKNDLISSVNIQVEVAIESADAIIFLVDVKDGVTATDIEITKMMRKDQKKVILACNKVDNFRNIPAEAYDFYKLGLGEPITISAAQGLNIGDLLDEVVSKFPDTNPNIVDYDDYLKVAIAGRPNVGKSSLLNAIIGEDRVIVSDTPGTTRDAIDTKLKREDQEYIFIDTAGIRKKSKINEAIEYYSVIRSFKAIERSDVVIMVISAYEGIAEQDKKIIGYAHDKGKASIIVINKWDLIEKDHMTMDKYREVVRKELIFMQYVPIIFVSAKTKKRVFKVIDLIDYVSNQYNMRVRTSVLNRIVNDSFARVEPPSFKGDRLKVYYSTQLSVKPPTFKLFVNNKKLIHFSYKRYLENQLRSTLGLEGTPIRIILQNR